MTRPAHEERALAQIEAGLRRSDPWLVALFDRLGNVRPAGRPPGGVTWKRFLVALVLITAAVAATVGTGQAAGRQAWPPAHVGAGIVELAGWAAGGMRAQLHDWRQEIRAQVLGSPPAP